MDRRLTQILLIAALAPVVGCGSGATTAGSGTARSASGSQGTTTAAHRGGFTPVQRRMIAAQRRLQRAQFSAPQLDARLGRLTGSRRRDAVVKAVETTILRDARRRYRAHELDQRPKSVSCSVSGDDEPLVKRNPRAPVVRYQCLAVTFRAAGMVVGTDFVARVDFAKPSFAWCRFIPVGGEGTHSAVTLAAPPPAACIADPPA